MHTPKILPWLARKAGISDERAEALWKQALREATDDTGWVGGPDFWAYAHNRLLELMQVECQHRAAPRISRFTRIQARLGRVPFLAIEGVLRAIHRRAA